MRRFFYETGEIAIAVFQVVIGIVVALWAFEQLSKLGGYFGRKIGFLREQVGDRFGSRTATT